MHVLPSLRRANRLGSHQTVGSRCLREGRQLASVRGQHHQQLGEVLLVDIFHGSRLFLLNVIL